MTRRDIPRARRLAAAVLSSTLAIGGAVAATSIASAPAQAVDNGLAKTPPMGFNDWNAFGCNVDEQLVKQTADFFVSSGLKAAGYRFVNIDDCWMTHDRDAQGGLVPDPVKFPDGIKGTADYVHSLGLQLGIYEDAGTATCAGYPGSLGHETTDANSFAAWGVDYLKYDNCNNAGSTTKAQFIARYSAMGDALKATGRPIVYSICEWGQNDPATWAGDVGNLWRTTDDINDSWGRLKAIIAENAPLAQFAHPDAWNDPDMLEVGNGGMTDTEYRTHFALWAEMSAPLLIGTDLRRATPETMAIYTNKALIAVDQDRLGVQGQVIAQNADGTMVFNKPLANGDRAVALYNSGDSPATVTTSAAQAGLAKAAEYTLTDLWSKARTETHGTISALVPAHGTVIYRLSGKVATVAPATLLVVTSSGAHGAADVVAQGGATVTATSTLTDYGHDKLTGVRETADAPPGWTITAAEGTTRASLGSGMSMVTAWQVVVPAGTAAGNYPGTVTATYTWGANGKVAIVKYAATVEVVPAPPFGSVQLSSLTWIDATNGWGPVEKDMSNGETAAGDGNPITIRGTVHPKGLGVNADSVIDYYLGGSCTSLTTTVGIDDEVATAGGDVIFQVYADDTEVADSGPVTNLSPAKTLTADLTGATWLRLHVDPDGSTNFDHADWAGPVLTCS